ncbi:MAG: rhodanese-like domain-containing protein [Desulfovibrionaceae bacterium]
MDTWTAVVIVVALLAVAWDPLWRLAGVRQLFPWELRRMLASNPGGVALLDVRTPLEYGLFHIRGARNVPRLPVAPELGRDPAARPRVVVCMTGHRSPLAAWRMRGDGETYNLTWGMLGWLVTGGPVERTPKD